MVGYNLWGINNYIYKVEFNSGVGGLNSAEGIKHHGQKHLMVEVPKSQKRGWERMWKKEKQSTMWKMKIKPNSAVRNWVCIALLYIAFDDFYD